MKFKKRFIFYSFFVILLLLGPLAVLNNPFFLGFINKLAIANFIQRSTALMAIIALTVQIYIGANLDRMTVKYGGWLYKFHLVLGILVFGLILIHIGSLMLFNFLASGKINPFYVFTDMCLICQNKRELFVSLGRISFWILIFTTLAAKIRVNVWWRRNWRYLHIFNYLIFYLISIHTFMVGSDIKSTFFLYIFILLNIIVLYTIINRVIRLVKK